MSGKKNVHLGHRERMRERFAEDGFDNYRPHEVLEQLLFETRPRVNTNPVGHDLIDRFGNVMNVLDADPEELQKVDGIGKTSAEFLASIKEEISDMIRDQYREMEKVTREMTAFLADWFMKKDSGKAGIIALDRDGIFREWYDADIIYEENEFSPEKTGDGIVSLVGEGRYIIVFAENKALPRSDVYKLLDHTVKSGLVMADAYALCGHKPVSLIFPEKEKEIDSPFFGKI